MIFGDDFFRIVENYFGGKLLHNGFDPNVGDDIGVDVGVGCLTQASTVVFSTKAPKEQKFVDCKSGVVFEIGAKTFALIASLEPFFIS